MNSSTNDVLKGLSFHELFDIYELQGIQDLFSDTMGLASVITTPDGTPLTRPSHESRMCKELIRPSKGGGQYCAAFEKNLHESRETVVVFPCLEGAIFEAVCSILVQNQVVAHWRIGQVRNPDFDPDQFAALAVQTGVEEARIRNAWEELPEVSEDRLYRIAEMVKRIICAFSKKAYAHLQLKAALEETAHLEERWKYALEGASDGVWDWDARTNSVFYSENWKRMLGYAMDEIGNSLEEWSSRVHPDDLDDVLKKTEQHLKGETDFYMSEHRLLCRDGSYKWILDEGKAVSRDDEGNALRLIGTHKDITHRKHIEEALRNSEENYRIIVENQNDLVVKVDAKGNFVYVSPSYCHLFGKAEEELIGNSFVPLIHEEDIAGTVDAMKKLQQEPFTCYIEQRAMTSLGWRWLAWSDKAIIDGNGKISYIIGVGRDITERKDAEAALINSERKFAGAFMTSPYAIIISRASDGKIVEVNHAFYHLTGYCPDEVRNNSTLGLNLWVNPEERKAMIRDLEQGVEVRNREYLFRTSNGKVVPGLYSASVFSLEGEFHVLSSIADISEQRRNEQKLRESEALYKSILDASPDDITITDKEGIILMASPVSLSLFGYASMDQIIGRSIRDFIHPDDLPRAFENIGKMAAGQLAGPGEYRGLRSDKTSFDIEVNGDFIRDETGAILNMIFIVRDITERKESERKLREQEETYRKLVETINDVIYEISPEGILRYVSPSSTRLLGYTPEEVIGTNLLDYIYEEDKPGILHALKDIIHREYTYLEYRYYARDGQVRWVRSSTTAIIQDGKLIGGTGSLTDITDRKLAEEELNKLSRAVEQSPVSIVITDLEGNIEYANPNSCETTGYKLEELLGNNPRILKSGDTQDEEYAGLWKDITQGKSWKGIFHNKRKNGDLYWESSTISPIMDPAGNILHYLAVKEDITEKILIEQALRTSENRLKQIIGQSQTIIWEIDMDGLYTYISPVVSEILGYDPMEITGKLHFYDLHPEEGRAEFKKLALELMRTGEQFKDYENPLVTKSGVQIWVSTNGAPVFDRDGHLKGYIGSDSNITDRKKSHVQLSTYNERLQAIVRAMPDLLFVMDKEGYYHEFYTADSTKLLIDPDKLIGMNMSQIFEERMVRLHYERIHECLEEQRLVTYEYTLGDDSGLGYFEARLTPIGSDRILALIRDITDAKHQDLELRKLSMAIEQSPVIIVITDLQARIEYVNPAFESTTGYLREDVLGKSPRILQSGYTPRELYAELWDTILAGKEWNGEWQNRKKNGEVYWESITITPINDGSGNTCNYLAVKQDITERKRAESEILELNQNLEQKVKERTRELDVMNASLRAEIEERIRMEKALILSEQRLRYVVENVTEVIFQTDLEGNWVFLNSAWQDVTGFPVDTALGKPFNDFVHMDDRKGNMQHFSELIRKEKEFNKQQVRYLTRDGGYRWVEIFARLGLDEEGHPRGAFGTLVDVTERRHKEEFERELLNLSAKLTGIRLKEIPESINLAMREIGYFLDADRSYIFEFHEDGKLMSCTYEWCREGIEPQIDQLRDIPIDIFPRWMDLLERNENVVISSVEDLPADCALEKEMLTAQDIKSLIAIPFITNQRLIGFVGLDSVRFHRVFTPSEVNNLKVWSNMLAGLIMFRQSEMLIEQTRRNYETFFNTIDDFLFVLNEEGRIIHINDTVQNRLGYSPEELIGSSVLVVHPPDRQEEAGEIVAGMLAGTVAFCPVPLQTKNKELIAVETRVKQGLWDGQPALFGVSKDVSMIKLSEEKFSKAFHSNTSIMMISRILDMKFLDVNDAFVRTFGFSREEALGKNPLELNLVGDEMEWMQNIELMRTNAAVREMEVRMLTRSGEQRTGLVSVETIIIGTELCVLGVMVDITERKKAEEEILRARNEAEKANLAKSEFLSRMSHELRTPLNSILGFAQLMELGEISQANRKGVNHILNSGKHLLNLINEVLDISRIEAGRLSLSIEPVLLNTVILEMLDVVSPNAGMMQQNLGFRRKESEGWFVRADRQRLKQVLLNLINNAIKYSGEGGQIRIETVMLPASGNTGDWCRVSVIDNGPGINPDDLPKLFTPFERIGAERTATEGTGLGLPIVKKLMDAMGGQVGVESNPGAGSCFWIELPLVSGYKGAGSPDPGTGLAFESPEQYTGTILYVEDNLPNVELVEDILQSHRPGIRLISTVFGEMALHYARENSPGLILLDLDLPDVNGAEVLDRLRANQETAGIPVVIISANAMPFQIKKLTEAGAEEYLTKPLEIKEFLSIVDRYLTK